METSATVRLIGGVRLIQVSLYTVIPKLGLSSSRLRGQVSLFTSGLSHAITLELFKETPNDVTYTLMDLESIY